MRVLITNDDGIRAQGLRILAQRLMREHDVSVVAPAQERSAASHALTIQRPLYLSRVELEGLPPDSYAVEGTPADCVKLALNSDLLDEKPEIVVSGINRGANLGTDVLYSGTVAAALEAALCGVSALAVSARHQQGLGEIDYRYAAGCAARLIERMDGFDLPPGSALSLNVPGGGEPPLGLKWARTAVCDYGDYAYVRVLDRDGNESYLPQGDLNADYDAYPPDTDMYHLFKGYATITPLYISLVDHATLRRLEQCHRLDWTDWRL